MTDDAILSDLLAFLSSSPTPFHAVAEARKRLDAVGFTLLDESEPWGERSGGALKPGKYYVTSGGSNLIAFRVPDGEAKGFRLLGAHTDSPNLRLKPKPVYAQEGYLQLGVEVYGGVLLNSWLDRDLGIAGRVTVRERDGSIGTRLLKVDRPLFRVPQLAVHLDREVNDKGLVLNRQEHMAPIFGLGGADTDALAELVQKETHVEPSDVLGMDLMLHDVTPACVAGAGGEFLFSGRLDNLAMCHASISALLSCQASAFVPLIALFDHEEIGSETMHGAGSAFLPRVLERIAGSREAFLRMCPASFFVSADMAHAVHPNYASRHEPRHKPRLNGGPVIKVNAQQRYATDGRTAALFADICRREDVPVQHYSHRTDLPCGTTIGPIVATLLGIPTVDVGNPMLSMHSAREMCGTQDPALMVRALGRMLGENG